MRKALELAVKNGTMIFSIGMLYYLWLRATGIGIPCLFRLITGYRCPGCGLTTMCLNLLDFKFVLAYHSNKFVFVSIPFLIFVFLYQCYLTANKKKEPLWYKVCCIGYIAAFVLFGIIRNII